MERETTRAGKPEWRKKSQGLGSPSGERDHKGWEAPVEKETTRAGKPEWDAECMVVAGSRFKRKKHGMYTADFVLTRFTKGL